MLSFLENPLLLLLIAMPPLLILGILLGTSLSKPRKHQVIKYLENDNRGYGFEVKKETRYGLYCDGVGNLPPQAFYKLMPSTIIYYKGLIRGLYPVVRYVAREANAFTQGFINNVEYAGNKLIDVIKVLWDEEDFNKLPQRLKRKLEESKIDVTLKIGEPVNIELKDEQGKPYTISEDEIYRERVERASEAINKGKDKSNKSPTINYIFAVGCGLGIGIVVASILKIGVLP